MSFVQKIKYYSVKIWQNITIEPVVAFYLTAIGLNEVIRPNLLLDKSCLYVHNYTQEICNDLNNEEYKVRTTKQKNRNSF